MHLQESPGFCHFLRAFEIVEAESDGVCSSLVLSQGSISHLVSHKEYKPDWIRIKDIVAIDLFYYLFLICLHHREKSTDS